MPIAKGLAHLLSAMPHSAIAHDGSAVSVVPKPSIARRNSKEWSRATARLNCDCAAALQDVAKETVPIFSNAVPCSCSCAVTVITTVTPMSTQVSKVRRNMRAVYSAARSRKILQSDGSSFLALKRWPHVQVDGQHLEPSVWRNLR